MGRCSSLPMGRCASLPEVVAMKPGLDCQYGDFGRRGLPKVAVSALSSATLGCGNDNVEAEDDESPVALDPADFQMTKLPSGMAVNVFDINLHTGEGARQNINSYFELFKGVSGLHVTTSCYSTWAKAKRTNRCGKIIPTDPTDTGVRVFFFDDNLEWDGQEGSLGICRLVDARSGSFVPFAEGENGFQRARAARHTTIMHSDVYRAVLVKANILDAMGDPEYFSSIVERFLEPGEKAVVFMDVNATIVCNDSIQGKDLSSTLLSTLFDFIQLVPRAPFSLAFDSHPEVKIEKPCNLRAVVKSLTAGCHESYGAFWTEERCWRLVARLAEDVDLVWSGCEDLLTLEDCKVLFNEYLVSLGRSSQTDGITPSWFHLYEALRDEHAIVLNSYGMDCRTVVQATVPCERSALQVTVNYDLWGDRDVQKFKEQFKKG